MFGDYLFTMEDITIQYSVYVYAIMLLCEVHAYHIKPL